MVKSRTLSDMEISLPSYYVVLLHRRGRLPELLSDRHSTGPAIFDSKAEANATGKINLKEGWKFTAVRLKD